jgi:hypothetical protein
VQHTADRGAAVRAAIVASLDVFGGRPDERFDRITRAAQEAFGVPLAALNVDDGTDVRNVSPDQAIRVPRRQAFCSTAVDQAATLVVEDAAVDDRFSGLDVVTGEPRVRFYAGVPVTTPGGTPVGTLCVMDTTPRHFRDDDLELLTELGRWAERVLADGRRADDLARVIRASRPVPLDLPGWTVRAGTVACHELEGGFHDWAPVDGALSLTVADVLGDGHGAGILAASVRSAVAARAGRPVARVVADAERQLAHELDASGSHVALFHARVDMATGSVDWVDAGLGVAAHVRADGTVTVLRSPDLPVGLQPADAERTAWRLAMRPGDALLIATPGFLRLHDGTLATLERAGARLHATGDVDAFLAEVDARASRLRVREGVTTVVLRRTPTSS